MRTVFRAQAAQTRLALMLCWALLLLAVAGAWVTVAVPQQRPVAERVAVALMGTVAAVLFVRLQLSTMRGGAALRARWFAPVIMVLAALPMLWGTLSPLLVIAWAPAFVQRNLRAAVVETVLLWAFLVWVFPRSGLEVRGGFEDLILELAMFTVILVVATRLAVLLDELRFTREALARRGVDAERERIGRDLHDLMGRTLVAASLHNQAALQLLSDADAETRPRLERLHETLSQGQARLRALTSGQVVVGLDEELATCRMLSERLHLGLVVDLRVRPPETHEGVVALAVREGITDIVRDGQATTCRVVIDRVEGHTVVVVTSNGGLTQEVRFPIEAQVSA